MSVVTVTWTESSGNYTASVGGTSLFTLAGVGDTNAIEVTQDDSTQEYSIKIPETALESSEDADTPVILTVSSGISAKLALGDGMSAPTQTNAEGWGTADGNDIDYNSAGTTAGYELTDTRITYVEEVESTALFTLSGISETFAATLTEKAA